MSAAEVELEHLVGFGSCYRDTLRCSLKDAHTVFYSAGSTIILEDLDNPHEQSFLRGPDGHDEDVCCLAVSPNGLWLASGQIGSTQRKGAVAPIVIWDLASQMIEHVFPGMTEEVFTMSFSPDSRFLAATGANRYFYIWDMQTHEVVYQRRTEGQGSLLVWSDKVEIPQGSRYPGYTLCTGFDGLVQKHELTFNISNMCYELSSAPFRLPASGLQRKYNCGVVKDDQLICGTSGGEICVFAMHAMVFRASLPCVNHGVNSLVAGPVPGNGLGAAGEGTYYVGGGDGRIKLVTGHDTTWEVTAENVLPGGVKSMGIEAGGNELVVGCANGKIWRLLCSDLTATLKIAAHTGPVTGVAFGTSSDLVVTVSAAGECYIWNLADYSLTGSIIRPGTPCRSVTMTNSGQVMIGYEDGCVRAYPYQGVSEIRNFDWHIPGAHSGAVTTIKQSERMHVTGGEDFMVRVWHVVTHQLLTQFSSHRRPVAELIIDNLHPHLIHSCSEDKMVVTYNLKEDRQMVQHSMNSGNFSSLCQRKDQEHETVTGASDGRILFWDVDFAEPQGCLHAKHDGKPSRITCLQVSPSGRYVAAGCAEALIYLFDLQDCQLKKTLQGHSKGIKNIFWSPDQKQIITVAADWCVCVWNCFE